MSTLTRVVHDLVHIVVALGASFTIAAYTGYLLSDVRPARRRQTPHRQSV